MTTTPVDQALNILLLEGVHDEAVQIFAALGHHVEHRPDSLGERDLIDAVRDVHVLGVRSKTNVTRKVFEAGEHLWAVGAFCVGVNQVDLDAGQDAGVVVYNAPYSNTRSVVELAIAEIVMLMRGIVERNTNMHAGRWDKTTRGSVEVRGKTLGIVGYGNIGSQLSVLAEAMGMHVAYYDRVEKQVLGNARKCRSLTELLTQADAVTVHVDGSPENAMMFAEPQFAAMKPGAVFLNLSRGFVVDLAALRRYIESGRVRGAAIDVYPEEPNSNDEPFSTPLRGLPNVILTPHVGGSTLEAQRNIASSVAGHLVAYLTTGDSETSVNFPGITLPGLTGAHRFVHIHRNEPGILARINDTLASHDINILGQYLKTSSRIGYVITDVAAEYKPAVIQKLKGVRHTIRFRVLY